MKYIYTLLALLLFPIFTYAAVIPDKIYATTPTAINNKLKLNTDVNLNVLKLGTLSNDMELENGDRINVKIKDLYLIDYLLLREQKYYQDI